ncbi:TetR/AcrR family transcriptional regulator [Paenibacillus sp. YPG26]|uniref:TetR/AcrR family transcriptional regulator n=1 Tax=Paenibacillus sp. YPG26 TaxID=2878915 RepID=UPI00203FA0E8|nr:TetR/AcrR family transcriptional regulator [Paenibacillus sp. YPG26]USB33206.1 TetR/AcrR family transcriptional regulator [Paenibacillus sp. YPG26]
MKKGEQTKQHIIMKSAELFNQKGFAGCSIKEIMDATGLTKGGIYRFFASKDEIALESLTYALEIINEHFTRAIQGNKSAIDKILAIFDVYADVVHHPPLQGGCPLLNTAIESDDTHPALRDKALAAMNGFLATIHNVLSEGVHKKELRPDLDLNSLASFVFSILEGSIMASKLEGDNRHVATGKENLAHYLRTFQIQSR